MRLILIVMVAAAALSAPAEKKYIFTSWELGDVTPQELLDNADKFDKTACDGVSIGLRGVLPGADKSPQGRRHIMEMPRWTDAELYGFTGIMKRIVAHPSLRCSFISINVAPRLGRLAWTDDAAWSLYADNMAAVSRFVERTGMRRLLLDFEDYWRKKQFVHFTTNDPPWRESLSLARARGRQVFGGVFRACPSMTILTFQLLTTDTRYSREIDPVAYMTEKRDLWPAFVNGIYDVITSEATIVDGNESFGYHAEAEKNDFHKSVRDQLVGVLPLVAKENRAKYRAQTSVSFGLYMDSYTAATNSPWYMGPKRGKRIIHFEDNLRQATECADEYVWFWGEKGFWIDWPADLKEKSCGDTWRSSGKGTWRGKYFEGPWGRIRQWKYEIDGDFDLMSRGVKDPTRCVREELARQTASGEFTNIVKTALKPNERGNVGMRIDDRGGMTADAWYGVVATARGKDARGTVYFQHNGSWRWNLGTFRLLFSKTGTDGLRTGVALVRIPDGANNIWLNLNGGDEPQSRCEFTDLKVFQIK